MRTLPKIPLKPAKPQAEKEGSHAPQTKRPRTPAPRKAAPRQDVPAKESPRPEASDAAVPNRQRTESRQHRRPVSRTEEIPEFEGQLTYLSMMELSYSDKIARWKELNKEAAEDVFITLLNPNHVPKQIKRDFPPQAIKAPSKEALFCCYCAAWMRFMPFSYTGYTRCIGCGMSTKDFHNVRANKLKD